MKHTKGEWEVTQMGNVIHKETGKMICATQSAFKEDMDNAKLIAVAPELLEAMQWFCDRVEKSEVKSAKTYARFKELINKATL